MLLIHKKLFFYTILLASAMSAALESMQNYSSSNPRRVLLEEDNDQIHKERKERLLNNENFVAPQAQRPQTAEEYQEILLRNEQIILENEKRLKSIATQHEEIESNFRKFESSLSGSNRRLDRIQDDQSQTMSWLLTIIGGGLGALGSLKFFKSSSSSATSIIALSGAALGGIMGYFLGKKIIPSRTKKVRDHVFSEAYNSSMGN